MNYVVSHTIDEEYLKDDTNKNSSHNRQMLIINLWNSINDVFVFTESWWMWLQSLWKWVNM